MSNCLWLSDLSFSFSPYSLAVANLSVAFSNCALKVEAGRKNISHIFTECFVETLSIQQWSNRRGSTCLSLGSVSANLSILYRASLQPFEVLNFYQEN